MKNLSIRAQLALSVLALVSLVLAVQLGLQSYVMRKDAVHRIETQEFRILREFADDLDEKLQWHLNMLVNESSNVPPVSLGNAQALEAYLQRQKAMLTVFDDLYVFDAKGLLLVDWPIKPGRRMLDMSERDYIQHVVGERSAYISKPLLGKATRQPIVVMAVPVLDAQQRLVGILAGVLNLYKPNLLGSIAKRKNDDLGHHFLVSRERVHIIHPDPGLVLKPIPMNGANAAFERAMQGFEGTVEDKAPDGERAIYTFVRLKVTNWVAAYAIPTSVAFAPIGQMYLQMLAITGVVLLISLPIMWVYSRRLSQPLVDLSRAMQQTALHMREEREVHAIAPRGSAEIRTVTQAFNAFVEARLEAEQQLSVARDAAQAANASKSQFLANMSHEIRTPMNGILGMTELCLQTPMSQEQRRYLDMVNTSARSLLAVINDILDFSKIEARKLELDPHEFGVHALVRDCSRMLSLRAAEKGLELVCDVDSDVPERLIGDPLRLQQVLTNLLANAIKFTAQGEVVLQVRRLSRAGAGVWLQWSVRDTGIGIAPDKQRMIFDTFTQADSTTARRFGGTGLGLAISRNLIEMMGGTIEVESEPGAGSTFRFTTRLQAAHALASSLPAGQTPHPLQGQLLLVVDDNASSRRWLVQALEQVGIHALACDGAAQALQSVQALHVRHALIDVNMPEIDGLALVTQLRKQRTPEQLGVVLMGNLSEQVSPQQMQAHAVQGFLLKPVDPLELVDVLGLLAAGAQGPVVPPALEASPPQAEGPSWRVLLAEDTPINQTLATMILTRMGHEVTVANNGALAVEAFAQGHFDVVLMDIQMPEMSGVEATQAIRALENERQTPHVPIIAVTAHALKGDRERYLEAGMNGYVAKPLSMEALVSEMGRCMAASV